MTRCEFSRQARDDLREIHDFIAQDSPRAATRFVMQLEEQCRKLATFPEMGQVCDDLAPSLRRHSAGNYIVFYNPFKEGIGIVRVVSGARDTEDLFSGS